MSRNSPYSFGQLVIGRRLDAREIEVASIDVVFFGNFLRDSLHAACGDRQFRVGRCLSLRDLDIANTPIDIVFVRVNVGRIRIGHAEFSPSSVIQTKPHMIIQSLCGGNIKVKNFRLLLLGRALLERIPAGRGALLRCFDGQVGTAAGGSRLWKDRLRGRGGRVG
jgi:hypothetical protein